MLSKIFRFGRQRRHPGHPSLPVRKPLPPRRRRPWVEELELRLNPDVSLFFSNGVLHIDALNGANSIVLSHDNATGSALISANNGYSQSFADYEYSSIQIDGNNASTEADILANVKPVSFIGASNSDLITVGGPGLFDSAAVTINDMGGGDRLVINDQINATTQTYTITNSAVTRSGGGVAAINYSGISNLVLNTGSAGEIVNVQSTAAGTTTTVNGGAGNDTITVGAPGLFNAGPVAVNGEGGSDKLVINDQANATSQTYTITNTSVSRTGGGVGAISYSQIANLVVNVGSAGEIVNVLSTAGGTATAINGGAGNDMFTVGAPGLFNAGSVFVNGQGGNDSLFINDQANTTTQTYAITNTAVSRTGGGVAAIGYAQISNLVLNAGSAGEIIDVLSTAAATTVNGGAGNDMITVGAPGLFNAGPVAVNGQGGSDSLFIDDQANATTQTYTVTNSSVSRTGGGVGAITYAQISNLVVNTGSAGEIVNVLSTAAGTMTSVNGGAGNDTISVGGSGLAGAGPLAVNGQGGNDSLSINDQANATSQTYTVTNMAVSRTGNGIAPISYSRLGNLVVNTGSAGENVQVLSTAGGTVTTINGGAGNDTFTVGAPGLFNAGAVVVNGQGGNDSLFINDQVNATAQTYTVTNTSVSRTGGGIGAVDYSQVGNLVVNAGSADEVINVQSTAAGTSTSVNGGPGSNTFVLSGGSANVNVSLTGSGTDKLFVQRLFGGQTTILTDASVKSGNTTATLRGIQQAEIDGGGSSEVIDARGFSGSTVLRGGGGGGIIYGGSGNDDIITGAGGYVVFDALGQNTFQTQPGDLVFGLANHTLTNAELSETGSLMVSLQGDSVIFNGPSGGGFRFTGSWQKAIDSQGRNVFTATSSTINLVTPLGDIPLPPLTVYTKPSNLANAGVYDSLSIVPGSLNLGFGDPASPLSSFLGTFGVDLSTPSLQYGIDLGGTVASRLGLPLANALPYFDFGDATGVTLSFGTASVNVGGKGLALAFDPADPSLFLKVNEFAFGGSVHGYIPFTPLQLPSALAGTLTNGVAGYGNLYYKGAVDLGEIPVTLGGDEVIGFDINHTGTPLAITGDEVSQLVNGQVSLPSFVGQSLNDAFVGVNGTIGLGYDKDGFKLALQLGQGTAIYEPGIFALHAATLDPFQGTFLDPILHPSVSVVADGYIKDFNDFNFNLTQNDSLLFGLFQASGSLHLGNTGLTVSYTANAPLGGGSVMLGGSIYADGSFSVTGSLDYSLDATIATVYSHADYTFAGNFTTGVSFGAHYRAGLQLGTDTVNLHANIDSNLSFSLDAGGFHINGSGGVDAGATVLGLPVDVSLSVAFNDQGFTIYLPSWLPFGNISVNW